MAVSAISSFRRSSCLTATDNTGAAIAPVMPGRVITRPAVPTLISKSCAIEFNTPMGRNSLVTSAKAVIATVKMANQLPSYSGDGLVRDECVADALGVFLI